MQATKRPRPSKGPAFRLAAFAIAVGLFVFSYWLGNRYKAPDLPQLQALLLSPAQPLPRFALRQDGQALPFAQAVDDWLLLWGGPLGEADLQRLISAHNRLADEARLQGRFRVWLLEPCELPLPPFIQPRQLDAEQRQRLYRHWQLGPGQNLLFLVNPQARLQAVFTGIGSGATMARDFRSILEHFEP
ncbi:hypothetical protein D5125_10385 [Magnetovirga frankeli]|uniref:hypothetical protein n=1 Tax=Magnetovirga frankeli TaxID=947516 RepID=UPI001293E20D|nr:hypothetical protein D5125_10385 [gamma proteobacterium SS-5]